MKYGDLIDRQAAIDFVGSMEMCDEISAEAYKKLTNYFEDMPSAQPMTTKSSDLINRDDAIWAVYKRIKQLGMENNADVLSIRQSIRDLPSAQPELIAQGAYVRGFEQGRTQGILDAKLEPTCNQLATDTISRQAAIKEFSCCELTPDGGIDANYAIDFLKQLPSAQPERKTGKWIIEPYDVKNDIWVHRCGECMKVAMLGSEKSRFNYCPNCGARMVQEGEQK